MHYFNLFTEVKQNILLILYSLHMGFKFLFILYTDLSLFAELFLFIYRKGVFFLQRVILFIEEII